MGRHSSGRSGPFILSVFGWLLPWLLIAVVVGVGIWMVADYLGRDEGAQTASEALPQEEEESHSDTPSETSIETRTEPEPTPTKEEQPEKKPVRLITEGITIQVLNGTNDPEAGDVMAARLMKLGYQVVAVEFSSTPYKETTVLWSFPQAEEAARALASKYDWASKLKPSNLSETVSMHVVVGRDETAGA